MLMLFYLVLESEQRALHMGFSSSIKIQPGPFFIASDCTTSIFSSSKKGNDIFMIIFKAQNTFVPFGKQTVQFLK